jgi:response regulator RpfG family c-di-GMP phosphodiesterase
LLEDLGVQDEEMFSFENGFEALQFIESNGADIIFSDINMPHMDGYVFAFKLYKLRKDLQNSFFAISGDESRESYRRLKQLGVHRFIKKPIDANLFNHFVLPEIQKRRINKKSS